MWDTAALDPPIHFVNHLDLGHLQLAQLEGGIRGIPHLPKPGRYGAPPGSTMRRKLRPESDCEKRRLGPVVAGDDLPFIADKQERGAAIFKMTGEIFPAARIMECDRALI